jgi:hypothetical protein
MARTLLTVMKGITPPHREDIACRRKQLITIGRHLNIIRMPPVITVKRPSIMTVASMKKRPIMLTQRSDTPSMPESILRMRRRLTLRNTEGNNHLKLGAGNLKAGSGPKQRRWLLRFLTTS